METILLVTALLLEVILSIACLLRNSKLIRVRIFVRVLEASAFLILIVSDTIHWGLKWYAVAFLLAILLGGSILSIVTQENQKNASFHPRTISKGVVLLAVWFIVFIPALVFPQYKLIQPDGKFSVGTKTYTYSDPLREETYTQNGEARSVTVQFYYPLNAEGKCPLILFSHGTFGVITSNKTLFNELASHGYVVASISHPYQSLYTKNAEGRTVWLDRSFFKEIVTEDAEKNKLQSLNFYQKWMAIRMGDIGFVIDHLKNETTASTQDEVYKLIDTKAIGVMGHSLGGSAALGIGEERSDIGAVLALESPFMADILGVKDDQFVWNDNPYPVPVLAIYSDNSWGHLKEWPQYAANAKMIEDPQPDAFNVYLQGAGHLDLTDLSLTSPFLTRVLNGKKSSIDPEDCLMRINQLALGFFDHYLKNEEAFSPQPMY